MKTIAATLPGACLIELEPRSDSRGSFSRTFCEREFAELGLESRFPQHSVSYSENVGTLRGMHFQRPPFDEVKVVRCLQGAIFDVIVDLRQDSPTYLRWQGFQLTAGDHRQLYIPSGFAHGFQTLTARAEVSYLISNWYEPSAATGVRYNDPAFAIDWPLAVSEISPKDATWPLLDSAVRGAGPSR